MNTLKLASAAFVLVMCGASVAAPENYKVDTAHSSVVYKIKHMNTANHYGLFTDLQGTLSIDEAAPEGSSMNLEIKADSINSGNQKRDEHVKGPDFLNVKQFPTITFKSTSVKKVGDKQLEVTGDLN